MNPSNLIYSSKGWKILSRAFDNERVSSTYLFYGPDGVGRWQSAVALAALLNCEDVQKFSNDAGVSLSVPCGQCRNCLNIFNLNYEGLKIAVPIPPHENKFEKAVDLTNDLIDIKRKEPFALLTSTRATNIPISLAREIKKSLNMTPNKNEKRVVIFYKMEKMKTASADALLKMIEEPAPETVIILIADKPDSLLSTIQSRSQKIKIDLQSQPAIENYLINNYEISPHKAKLFSSVSSGSIGQALEMVAGDDDSEASRRSVMLLIFKSIFVENSSDTLAHMNDLLSLREKTEAEQLLTLWQLLIRDCAHYAVSGDETSIINVDFTADIKKISNFFPDSSKPALMSSHIKNTLADLKRNVHIQGALMALALKMRNCLQA